MVWILQRLDKDCPDVDVLADCPSNTTTTLLLFVTDLLDILFEFSSISNDATTASCLASSTSLSALESVCSIAFFLRYLLNLAILFSSSNLRSVIDLNEPPPGHG